MARRARDYKDGVKPHAYYDYALLFLTVFMVCFGLVMIYSASSYISMIKYKNTYYFLRKQAISAAIGVVAMIVVSKIPYGIYIKPLTKFRFRLIYLLYLVCFGLQALVLVKGKDINGAKRWLSIAGISFQPSEICKILAVLFVSFVVCQAPKKMDHFTGFLRVMLYMAPILALIAKENLSTAIIIAGILVTICFVGSREKKYYVLVVLLGIAGIMAYIFGVGYRSNRVWIWRNLENSGDAGLQILQGLYAIANGGFWGKGLGQGMQKLGKIPEAYNDMIFSVICEELGFFGAIVVILLFIMMCYRIFIIAISAPDMFGGLICSGVLAQIALQVIINIAVVTNSIPSTGIALPFISYGGTSVAILLAEMGIVLSVSNQISEQKG